MSPVSAKTSAPSASPAFTYTKGVASRSALKALPRWTTLWSAEVCAITDAKKKKKKKFELSEPFVSAFKESV